MSASLATPEHIRLNARVAARVVDLTIHHKVSGLDRLYLASAILKTADKLWGGSGYVPLSDAQELLSDVYSRSAFYRFLDLAQKWDVLEIRPAKHGRKTLRLLNPVRFWDRIGVELTSYDRKAPLPVGKLRIRELRALLYSVDVGEEKGRNTARETVQTAPYHSRVSPRTSYAYDKVAE